MATISSALGMFNKISNVADNLIHAAKVIGEPTIGAAMKQQQIIDTFSAKAGSEPLGEAIYHRITKQALALGQDVDASLSGTMSFMSNTIDPSKLEQLNGLAMRLSMLNPTEGLEGAASSMKELMSGNYTSMADRFNMSGAMLEGSEVRQAGLKGNIDEFIKGMDELLNQQNMTQEAFEKLLDRPAIKWQRVVSNFNFNMAKAGENSVMALTPLFDLMNQMFEDGRMQAFFNGLSVAILIVSKLVSNLASIALGLGTGILQNWGMVVPLLWMIIGALIIYNSKSLISMANTAKDIVLKIAHAAASSAETLAIIGLIIAQEGLNAAIALCPITWIIGAIIILIAVFYLAVAAVNHFAGTSISATGLIAGLFGVLFGFIYNRFAKFANIVLSIVEFFANVWKDPIYAVKKLFYDLSINALEDMVNIAKGIENLINRIPGMHIDITSGMEGILDKLKSERDDLESEADVVNLMRFEQKDYGEAFKSGYKWGDDLSKKFDLTNMFGLNNDIGAIAAGGEEEGIPNIDRVGEVGKINNTVDISSEDLKIMRELAEMKNIQNFVTLTPTVSVTTGDIRNGSDADTIVSRIKTMLERDIASSTSAVYG